MLRAFCTFICGEYFILSCEGRAAPDASRNSPHTRTRSRHTRDHILWYEPTFSPFVQMLTTQLGALRVWTSTFLTLPAFKVREGPGPGQGVGGKGTTLRRSEIGGQSNNFFGQGAQLQFHPQNIWGHIHIWGPRGGLLDPFELNTRDLNPAQARNSQTEIFPRMDQTGQQWIQIQIRT